MQGILVHQDDGGGDDLITNNNTINWIQSIGKEAFWGLWLENVKLGHQRNRYWGTPLNIWECRCGHQRIPSGIAELKEMSITARKDIEHHRPYSDAVTK